MNFTDLEEFEGVTQEAMDAWMIKDGWIQTSVGWCKRIDGLPVWVEGFVESFDYTDRSVQAVLREMNPRLREGLPSLQARLAHEGRWICHYEDDVYIGRFRSAVDFEIWDDSEGRASLCPEIHGGAFWPVDEHGNKVPWPRDAEGKEL